MTLAHKEISFPKGRQVEIQAATILPVSVLDAKTWMQIDFSDHNAIIEQLIKAIDRWIARELGVITTERTVIVSFERMGRNIDLDLTPIKSIDEVVTIDDENAEETLTETDDYVIVRQDLTRLYIKSPDDGKQLKVSLTCGVDNAGKVDPEDAMFLKDAVLAAYEARGQNVSTGEVITSLSAFDGVAAKSKMRMI